MLVCNYQTLIHEFPRISDLDKSVYGQIWDYEKVSAPKQKYQNKCKMSDVFLRQHSSSNNQ